ncbi:helix-turn-helix transcriptional regulator [Aerococcus sp. HMSC10H05]|uniref:helix-turn-helix domain-containing protein n=1 Tax=Aerococcus sp. HMSC10H05 TaxID=1581084 RepID=UPI0008A1DD1A|nr:helix-turn-helix transcriptional regulator [Aerococcus sp. HMSC10H05]OFU49892.1 transcriptional regulator [Aerococcus sp. HMSC10H05]
MKNNFSIILAIKHKKISDVHKATGIAKSTLTRLYYERVDDPNSMTLIKIADYLGCSLDELLARVPYVVEV